MNTFRNAEEALEYLIYNIRLGTYDKKFMLNLQTTKVLARKPITSNQHSLFKKVVQKYHKQLAQKEIDSIELSTLPWSLEVVPSTSEYTESSIKIENDQLILYTPYKATFLKEFRPLNLMDWNRDEKRYTAPYGLRTLKLIMDVVCRHYSELSVCDTIKNMLNELAEYETVKYWTPTLIKSNGRLYIAASNQYLDDAMGNVELDLKLSTLSKIAALGINTSEFISQLTEDEKSPELMLALTTNATWDLDKFYELGPILKQIEADYLIIVSSYSNVMDAAISAGIEQFGIPFSSYTEFKIQTGLLKQLTNPKYKHPVHIRFGKHGSMHNLGKKFASKVIDIVDSTPIALT
jgi:hypothetical protein